MSSIVSEWLRLDGPEPIHEQIASQLRRLIGRGTVNPGDRLPAARALAASLGVHTNTVLRAYRDLAQDRLVELRPGRGATVRELPDVARLYALADELVSEARRLGISRGELAALLIQRM